MRLLPTHPPTHSHLPTLAFPYTGGIDPSQDQGPLLPFMPDKAIIYYISSWGHGSLHVYSLVGGLVPGSTESSGWLFFVFLPMGWQTPSAPCIVFSYKNMQCLEKWSYEVETYGFFGKSVVMDGFLLGQSHEGVFSWSRHLLPSPCFAKANMKGRVMKDSLLTSHIYWSALHFVAELHLLWLHREKCTQKLLVLCWQVPAASSNSSKSAAMSVDTHSRVLLR
jgi:hypothetical protein